MGAVVPMNKTGALTRNDPRRLTLFKNTAGKHLTPIERDWAVEYCEIYGANALVGDIHFFVFDANDAEKRRMVPVLSIQMYRKIAARTKNYRPDDKPSRFTYDEEAVSNANPKGIVDCEVTVYQFSHGEWFPVTVKLKWEERAPILKEGEDGFKWEPIPGEFYPEGHKKAGKQKHRRVPAGEVVEKLDPTKKNWRTMPETMLAKCVEAACIRKAWPNETAGSYVEGELDAVNTIDLTATEIIDEEERNQRLERIGSSGQLILIDWMDGGSLVPVPVGKFYDAAMAFIQSHMKLGEEEHGVILQWKEKNRHGLQTFWALEKDAALSLKKKLEEIEARTKS